MTTESKCPKCGTVLTDDPDIGHTGLEITKDGPWHSSNRCRDVLRAQLTEVTRQRDEAIRALDASADMLDYVAPRSAMTGVDDALLLSVRHAARAALEVLRGKL